jgi:hypothetical protein
MDKLSLGDMVRTGEGIYEAIYGWAHRDNDTVAEYLLLYTKNTPGSLEVTSEHLLFVPGPNHFVAAGDLQVGDLVATGDAADPFAAITKIQSASRNGLYAPLTPSGTLIVDGIKTSCYIAVQGDLFKDQAAHYLSHLSLSPIRLLCLGVSPNFCSEAFLKDTSSSSSSSYAWYVRVWFAMTQFYGGQGSLMQTILALAYFFVFGIFWSVERVFGSSMAPTVCLGLVVAGLFGRLPNSKCQKDN